MRTIRNYIAEKQELLRRHRFFDYLASMSTMEEFRGFVLALTFWPLLFQDVLRLNETKVKTPYLHRIARHHRIEDRGHDKWFLEDILRISGLDKETFYAKYNIEWLFDHEKTAVRDASYAIVSEVFKLEDERLRVILLLTLESSGHVFFEAVANQAKVIGCDSQLKYFSSFHLDVEKAHALFEDAMEEELFSIVLLEDERRQAIELVDRSYAAFFQMFDELVDSNLNSKAVEIKKAS